MPRDTPHIVRTRSLGLIIKWCSRRSCWIRFGAIVFAFVLLIAVFSREVRLLFPHTVRGWKEYYSELRYGILFHELKQKARIYRKAEAGRANSGDWLVLGLHYRSVKGDEEKAITCFIAGMKAPDANILNWIECAEILTSQGRRKEALQILGGNPHPSGDYYALMAELHESLKEHEAALLAYAKAIKAEEGNPPFEAKKLDLWRRRIEVIRGLDVEISTGTQFRRQSP